MAAALWRHMRWRRAANPKWSRESAVVLSYHNVVPDGADLEIGSPRHVPRGVFGAQLDALMRTFDVVPLEEIVAGGGQTARTRPRAAITFNGCYSGAMTTGLAEVRSRGLPATVFVSPSMLGGRAFWWDAVDRGDSDSDFETCAVERANGDGAMVRALAAHAGLSLRRVPAYARSATEEELHRAAELDGISIGTHGLSHVDLTRLDPDALCRELRHALQWIERRVSRAVAYLALPYGRSSPLVAAMARQLGYRAGLLSSGGCIRDCSKRAAEGWFLMPRVEMQSHASLTTLTPRAVGFF